MWFILKPTTILEYEDRQKIFRYLKGMLVIKQNLPCTNKLLQDVFEKRNVHWISANIKIFSGQGPNEYMRNVVYGEVLEM
ncbi:unnamed protein product [Sphagnum balticum]